MEKFFLIVTGNGSLSHILIICKKNSRLLPLRELSLWCLMPLSTIFQLCRGGHDSVLLVEETGVPGKNLIMIIW